MNGTTIMEIVGYVIIGITSVGVGSSVVLFKYNEVYGHTLKYNWYIIAQVSYITFNTLSGVAMYLLPYAATAFFIPIQILSAIILSYILLGQTYSKVQLGLLLAICLMYIPIFITGPTEMDHGKTGFLQRLESHLDSPLTIIFLCCFGAAMLTNATIVSILTINTTNHHLFTISASCFIAQIAAAFLAIFKMSIEVISRIIQGAYVSTAYYVAFGALPALGFLQLKLQGLFYAKLDIGVIYPLKVSFLLVLAWLESFCFFHERPKSETVFLISVAVQALLLGLYIVVSPKEDPLPDFDSIENGDPPMLLDNFVETKNKDLNVKTFSD